MGRAFGARQDRDVDGDGMARTGFSHRRPVESSVMILLDTHAWIWWASQSPKLSAAAREAIAGETGVGVAAISCWEVAMLSDKGRLKLDRDVGL